MPLPLVLLHGAVGTSDQLQPLAEKLSLQHEVHLFNFPGHGDAPPGTEKFSISVFADALVKFINDRGWAQVDLFGFSMGGYVAMFMARHYPDLINKVITLGTKYHWDEQAATREMALLDPEIISVKVPSFAKRLKELHQSLDWKEVLSRTSEMLQEMGAHNPLQSDDYKIIEKPALLMLGDKDKTVTLEETVNAVRALRNGQLAVLPGTPHAIEKADVAVVSYFVERFLKD